MKKHIKGFGQFINESSGKDYTNKLFDFIDTLNIEEYMKASLKNSDDLIILWNTGYAFNQGNKDLMKLFQPETVDYYNSIIRELGQDSYINSFYDGADEFVEVIDRLYRYTNNGFVMSEIFSYCNPVALRYLSDAAIKSILLNKNLIRKFQALWVMPLVGVPHTKADNRDIPKSFSKERLTGIKPFVPTSYQEHEDRINDIILDSF